MNSITARNSAKAQLDLGIVPALSVLARAGFTETQVRRWAAIDCGFEADEIVDILDYWNGNIPLVQPNRELGQLVGWVQRQVDGISAFLDDPITRASGCADELLPAVNRQAATAVEVVLRTMGYRNYADFVDEVEARTSPKWVYFYSSLGCFCDVNGSDFFLRETVR